MERQLLYLVRNRHDVRRQHETNYHELTSKAICCYLSMATAMLQQSRIRRETVPNAAAWFQFCTRCLCTLKFGLVSPAGEKKKITCTSDGNTKILPRIAACMMKHVDHNVQYATSLTSSLLSLEHKATTASADCKDARDYFWRLYALPEAADTISCKSS